MSTRILFFLPQLVVGGAEIHALSLFSLLKGKGYNCKILVFGKRKSVQLAARLSEEDVQYLNLKGMSEARGWLKVRNAFQNFDPDLILCINQGPLIISVIERMIFGIKAKLACIFHTTKMQNFERYHTPLLRIAGKLSDLMIYVANHQKALWEAQGLHAKRAVVIQNGIDLQNFQLSANVGKKKRRELGLGASDIILGIVATFRVEKNHGEVLRALAHARSQGSRAKLLAVGSGPTFEETKALAAELGLKDHTYFIGEQSDVASWIAACDVGVLCSTTETFPISVLEFLASGVPMIVSAVAGTTEIVSHEVNGLVYPGGDVDALANAIMQMEAPALRKRLASETRKSVAPYNLLRMRDAYMVEIDALVGPNKK